MDRVHTRLGRLQVRLARLLARETASAWIMAGTIAVAGLGAATLNASAQRAQPAAPGTVTLTVISNPYQNCYADPDGDGHYFCPGDSQFGWQGQWSVSTWQSGSGQYNYINGWTDGPATTWASQ